MMERMFRLVMDFAELPEAPFGGNFVQTFLGEIIWRFFTS